MRPFTSLVPDTVPRTCRRPRAAAPAGTRILVFGCARSGTTLMLNLLRAFTTVSVRDREHCLADLLDDPNPGWVAVKRTPHCAEHLQADLRSLRLPVWVIDMIRDPRDVVTSRLEPFPGYYCDYERWNRDLRVSEALAGTHLRYLRIRYEHLVAHPDTVQDELAAILHLPVTRRFADVPDLIPASLSATARQALGGIRPLEQTRIGRWRQPEYHERVRTQLGEHPQMETHLQWMGYSPTPDEAPPIVHRLETQPDLEQQI